VNRMPIWAMLLVVSIISDGLANDWPEFRGPLGNGHATSSQLPVRWSKTENVAWKQPIAGEGWSSPVIGHGKIYVTVAIPSDNNAGKDYSLRLRSFDLETGKPELDLPIFDEKGESSPNIHRKNSHASPTPLIHGDRIYVHFGHQGTACVNAKGKLLWQNRSLAYPPVHGAGGSPVLVGDRLIFSCDGGSDPFVVALDASTGKVAWKFNRKSDAAKKFSFSTPVVITVNNQQQVISPGSDVVNALDPVSGDELWRAHYDGYSVIPKPVVGHGLIFVCTGYEKPSLVAIRMGGSGDVTESNIAWRVDKGIPHTPSILLVDEHLYMVSDGGVASCFEAKTGKSIWQNRIGGDFSASPLFANGLIYFQSEDGTTTVIKASPTYEVVATNKLDERTFASFAVSGNKLILRSESNLYCLEEK
jgi:outer membrane protein assembly factor BamB